MKYLISLYFDESTNKQMRKYIESVAGATGNDYMLANKVPPHITLSSFETENLESILPELELCLGCFRGENIQWIGAGAFKTSTLYLAPIPNQYLQSLMEAVTNTFSGAEDIKVSKFYQQNQWLPHTTIGKKLDAGQLVKAFEVVQEDFKVISGQVVKIGLAKASPYEDILVWNCK